MPRINVQAYFELADHQKLKNKISLTIVNCQLNLTLLEFNALRKYLDIFDLTHPQNCLYISRELDTKSMKVLRNNRTLRNNKKFKIPEWFDAIILDFSNYSSELYIDPLILDDMNSRIQLQEHSSKHLIPKFQCYNRVYKRRINTDYGTYEYLMRDNYDVAIIRFPNLLHSVG